MSKEGYLQMKIGNLEEEVKELTSSLNNLRTSISSLHKIKEETELNLKLIQSIQKTILESDIMKIKSEIIETTASNLKDSMIEGLSKNYRGMINKISDRMDSEIWPVIEDVFAVKLEGIGNLIAGNFNLYVEKLNEEIPTLNFPFFKKPKLFSDLKESQVWLKIQEKRLKRKGNAQTWVMNAGEEK